MSTNWARIYCIYLKYYTFCSCVADTLSAQPRQRNPDMRHTRTPNILAQWQSTKNITTSYLIVSPRKQTTPKAFNLLQIEVCDSEWFKKGKMIRKCHRTDYMSLSHFRVALCVTCREVFAWKKSHETTSLIYVILWTSGRHRCLHFNLPGTCVWTGVIQADNCLQML